MTFTSDVQRWVAKVQTRELQTLDKVAEGVFQSVVNGSAITGAPGQPVAASDDPKLKNSWTKEVTATEALISTPVDYAPDVEAGTRNGRAMALRSPTGGFHSVALTVAGFGRLVEHAVHELPHDR